MITTQPRILGALLVQRGAISEAALEAALSEQVGSGRRLGEILVERGRVGEDAVARSLSDQLGLAFEPGPFEPEPGAVELVRAPLARARRVLPIRLTARALTVAMADPLDLSSLDDIRFQVGRRVEAVIATPAAVRDGLSRAYGGELDALVEALPAGEGSESDDVESLERAAKAAPVVRLVDHLLHAAVDQRASDIHVQEQGGRLRVRHRVDGILVGAGDLPGHARRALLSRLKVMAGMDISVKRRPQDGGLVLEHERRSLSLRVSTLPVPGGEKAVLRILDPTKAPSDLEALGLGAEDLRRVREMLRSGQGVVLAAGPTGSGKSSTLHAALHEVDRESLNVVTLEDPIEYPIPGATQVQVDPKAGLTFPAALRSVLRQDPDVVMIGEIRDRETAEIAMAAAVTGHLVLSTIHTTDAVGAVTRLLEMGVPPYLVAGGLAGVVAQRLVRKSCAACRGRSSDGCLRCRGGYRGRTGVFQVLAMDEGLREAVVAGRGSVAELRKKATDSGMGSMADDARRKVAEGVTTPHEVGRALRGDAAAASPCRGCGSPVPAGGEGCPTCGKPRHERCTCGGVLQRGWRFCPWCLRRRSG